MNIQSKYNVGDVVYVIVENQVGTYDVQDTDPKELIKEEKCKECGHVRKTIEFIIAEVQEVVITRAYAEARSNDKNAEPDIFYNGDWTSNRSYGFNSKESEIYTTRVEAEAVCEAINKPYLGITAREQWLKDE